MILLVDGSMVFKRSCCLSEHEFDLKKAFASFLLCNVFAVEVSMLRGISMCVLIMY